MREHWPEYFMEAAGMGIFMVSTGVFGVLLFLPPSPVVMALPDPLVRRVLMGLAMGMTAVCIIYSPWGQQSGAHLNPAITLTFLYLGKVAPWDALFYIIAQFLGGVIGVFAALGILGEKFSAPPISYMVTMPGNVEAAFIVEVITTFILMSAVLIATNSRQFSRYTGLLVGSIVAAFIALAAPVSGMSMNPARSFASAFLAMLWNGLWIYSTAPPLGMLTAAMVYRMVRHGRGVVCAKLNHRTTRRCIFLHCRYEELMSGKE